MTSQSSATPWQTPLDDYTSRLTDRINFLGLRHQTLGTAAPPALTMAVDELTTAAEALRASQAALQAQARALAASQEQLETARRHEQAWFDLCPDVCLVTDATGRIQAANLATSALVGYARSYILGKPLPVLLDPSDSAVFATKLLELQQTTDDRPQTWELQLRPRRTGPPRQATIRVAPIRDATGACTGYRWLLRDVTEARTTAAALADLQAHQAQQLRTRTMELEAVVRMQQEVRALDQAALTTLLHDSTQALQQGAAPGGLLAHLLRSLQAHLAGQTMVTAPDPGPAD
jgi:PAS domain S-box-containing protein